MGKNNSKYRFLIVVMLFLALLSCQTYAYKVESPATVHQHITNESKETWELTPPEMKNRLVNNLDEANDNDNYNSGDDIITGSSEEDYGANPTRHFWEPDNPRSGRYSDGYLAFPSSFERAKDFWEEGVIENYLRGNIDEAYYWLGRVAHLLEDASVPAHMHLDNHYGEENCATNDNDDALECLTASTFSSYGGDDLAGEQYDYEDLISSFSYSDWEDINPKIDQSDYPTELFKLFWYTAQKTQTFASDDEDGNEDYRKSGSSTLHSLPDLWSGEGVTKIIDKEDLEQDDITNSGTNITAVADAVVPHAMKATAGLYRLFWDSVHTDWSTFHKDNMRSGFTLLKGDIKSASQVDRLNLVLENNVDQDHISRASVADVDGNGEQDIVIASSKLGGGFHDGIVFGSETRGSGYSRRIEQRWNYNVEYEVEAPPSIGNIDSDKNREVVFGLDNGTFIALDISSNNKMATKKWAYTVPKRYSTLAGGYYRGNLAFSAIADLDGDGDNEIIFEEGLESLPDWPGEIYVVDGSGSSASIDDSYTLSNGGGRGAPSIADVDKDGKLEIVVPSYYGVFVFNYDGSTLTKQWSNTHGKINGAIVISDIDKDGDYELIYTTHTSTCHVSKTCYDRLYITDVVTGTDERTINLPAVSRVTPAVGDIDGDGDNEIIVNLEDGYGKIGCYEITGSACSGWPESVAGVDLNTPSPDIVDIDGDGDYEVLVGKSNSKKIAVLGSTGSTEFQFEVEGTIGSAPAIADLDEDGVAEIAIKRAGSPITVLTTISFVNEPPEFVKDIGDIIITGIEGEVVDINETGDIAATDRDGDYVNITYSTPFNSSGQWQTAVGDFGNYTVYLEADDKNLSTSELVEVFIFEENTLFNDSFSDNTQEKVLTFSGSETKNATVRLPKNANIVFSRIRIEGDTA